MSKIKKHIKINFIYVEINKLYDESAIKDDDRKYISACDCFRDGYGVIKFGNHTDKAPCGGGGPFMTCEYCSMQLNYTELCQNLCRGLHFRWNGYFAECKCKGHGDVWFYWDSCKR